MPLTRSGSLPSSQCLESSPFRRALGRLSSLRVRCGRSTADCCRLVLLLLLPLLLPLLLLVNAALLLLLIVVLGRANTCYWSRG